MKKTIILFVTFFISQVCFPQQRKTNDSIVKKKVDSIVHVVADLMRKDLKAAETMINYSLQYCKEHNYLRGIGQAHGTLAGVYNYQGKTEKSITSLIKSAQIYESINDYKLSAVANINICFSLYEQSQYNEATEYVLKAHDYALKADDLEELVSTHTLFAIIGVKTKKSFEYVIKNLKKAEEFSLMKKDSIRLAGGLNLQGEAYIEYDKSYTDAINLLNKAIYIIKKKEPKNNYNLGFSYLNLGKAYYKMKDYRAALLYNDTSLTHYNVLKYTKGLRLAYKSRKDILASQGKYKQSIEAYKLFNNYNDLVFKKEQIFQLARVRTEYETEQITAQKETAETKLKLTETISQQNRSYFIGTLIIGFFMLMTAIFYFKRLRANKKIEFLKLEFNENEKRLKLEKQLVASKLESLQSQMNPHFTFNALNSIQNLVLKDRKYEAYDYLNRFSSLLRENLNMSKKSYVFFDDELQLLTKYLELEQLRFRENFEYEIKGDDKVGEIKIPTMIIQPYIENAIKHGLLHKINGTKKLSITFIQEDVLTCIVEDNGVGIEASQKIQERNGIKKDSFSTSAIKDKMSFLRDHYKTDIGVVYEDVQQGTKVIIKMPYKDF